jgi:hypothetical protein
MHPHHSSSTGIAQVQGLQHAQADGASTQYFKKSD